MPTPISIVVPCYRSEESLPILYEQLTNVLHRAGREFELILVDDSSPDGTWGVIQKLASHHGNIRGMKMIRNFGQHNALLCGIREAQYPIIVTMDDDLQHPPEEVLPLVEKLECGYDVVYGTPAKESHGLFRDFASRLIKWTLAGVMGTRDAQNVSAFRAFRTPMRQAFADYRGPYVSIDVLLSWGAKKFVAVKVENPARKFGTSNYTFRKLVTHAINIMTGFSTLPLKIASFAGFASFLFGLAVLVWVLVRYFVNGHNVPGFAFLASVIAIFSGVQLFALGVFGEYLGRIHVRTLDRPSYIVEFWTNPQVREEEHRSAAKMS